MTDTETGEVICEQCEGTGWKRHPWRDGYTWCDCAAGEKFRTVYRAKRANDGTWHRASSATTKRRQAS